MKKINHLSKITMALSVLALTVFLFSTEVNAQKYITKNGHIKGVTNAVKKTGTFEVTEDGKVHGLSVFNIKLSDYKIKIPSAVTDNIGESIEITVDIKLDALKK